MPYKAHKTKASVKIRMLASVALALYARIPAGIIIRMTMTYYATAMSYPRHTATCMTHMLLQFYEPITPLAVISTCCSTYITHDWNEVTGSDQCLMCWLTQAHTQLFNTAFKNVTTAIKS